MERKRNPNTIYTLSSKAIHWLLEGSSFSLGTGVVSVCLGHSGICCVKSKMLLCFAQH